MIKSLKKTQKSPILGQIWAKTNFAKQMGSIRFRYYIYLKPY